MTVAKMCCAANALNSISRERTRNNHLGDPCSSCSYPALPDGFYTVKAADLQAELATETKPAIIDLRNDEEFATGSIEGAVHIPIQQLLADMTVLPAKDAAVVLTCQSGHRGGIGLMILSMLGWTNVRNLAGGMAAWTAAELPVVK